MIEKQRRKKDYFDITVKEIADKVDELVEAQNQLDTIVHNHIVEVWDKFSELEAKYQSDKDRAEERREIAAMPPKVREAYLTNKLSPPLEGE